MSRETNFETRMEADSALMLILTGGVHTKGAVGPEGITRDTVPAAFDANGNLKPTALVSQRALVPDGQVVDELEAIASAVQVVEIYLYERFSYSSIDSALSRLYALFQGYQFSDSAPVSWVFTSGRERDEGALSGASLVRTDYLVPDIQGA